jgi:hypothetical protein
MKKLFTLAILILPLLVKAQYGREVLTYPESPTYVYLGSLPASSGGNYHNYK